MKAYNHNKAMDKFDDDHVAMCIKVIYEKEHTYVVWQ